MRSIHLNKQLVLPIILLSPSAALAHNGGHAVSGFISGILHPFTGLDHLLAILAVGIVTAQQSGKSRMAIPAIFLSLMLIGAMAGTAGIVLPQIEAGILASVMILGLMAASAKQLPANVSGSLIGVFALLHGQAHGMEIPASASTVTYFAGFLLACLLIQSAALICADKLLKLNANMINRIAGASILLGGAVLASF